MTVQERGAGLGDIFTQNTLSAIKAVCQVLGLSLCGREGGLERGHSPWRPPHQPEFSSWEATAAHTCLHADAHSRVSPFPEYYILLGDWDSLKTEKNPIFLNT